jgi:hypothetical protein
VRTAPAIVVLASAMLAGSALAACGAASPAATPSSRGPLLDGGAEAGAAEERAVDGVPSLDALAARGPTDAPLMREALRVEHASPRSPDVRAERDLCLRAVFAAARPVRAWFADESGAARGEIASGASGTVPPRGPVCAKKGEALHLVVETTDASARAVIFAAP